MKIQKVNLNNFRNFKSKLLNISPITTVIIGPNAIGKTNILESLYLLSTGKSFRAHLEEEMIAYDEEIGRVAGMLSNKTKLEVVLTRGEITIGEDPGKVEKAPRKKLLVNGVSRRLIDFVGNFRVVLFAPWHLDLVTESPSGRRDFLDSVLSQVDREYRRASLSYEKGLRQRNKLLFRVREEGLPRTQLLFWDKLLIKNGNYISEQRREFFDFVNARGGLNDQNFSLDYDASAISEARLEQYADEEVAAATTLVGPHRDDFVFKVTGNNSQVTSRELARFGSRGEQRMGVLWLKLAELAFIEEKTNEKPTLLLDDIFSELDHEHRDIVIAAAKSQQTIITTADPHYIEGFEKVEKIRLDNL
jgi:DNA replication and repair protein RecF